MAGEIFLPIASALVTKDGRPSDPMWAWMRQVTAAIAGTGGSAVAPADAPFVTSAADATLTNERVATTSATVSVDLGTAGQVKWHASGTTTGGAGVPGVDGDDGLDGMPGLAGPTGPTGATGPAGPAISIGIPGDDGSDGTDGIQGATGAQGPAGAGGPLSMSVLTSGTAATYTVPANIVKLWVRCQGAGGGGGGADGGSTLAGCGGGGGGGSYVEKIYATTPGATFTYTIGTAGAGGVAGNNAGTAGNDTLFDEAGAVLTAKGGTGGQSAGVAAATFAVAAGGIGGLPTGGTWSHRGDRAQPGVRISGTAVYGGAGGNAPLGAGGTVAILDAVGNVGFAYGGGGGGGSATTVTDRAGGDGFAGVIIVMEYDA